MDGRKYLSKEERERFEAYLIDHLSGDARNCILFLTALHTGARAQELLALTWADIDTVNGSVFIHTLKRGRDRSIPVPKFLRLALARLKDLHPDKPFAISYSRLWQLWREYRPCTKTFHSLRHTYAMRTLEKSDKVHFVMRALGHRDIRNTMVYLDHQYSLAEHKKIMGIR